MLNALLLATLTVTPQHNPESGCTLCDSHSLEPRIQQIVAEAWQEAAPQLTKEQKAHANDLKRDVESGKKYSEEADKELKASKNEEFIKRVQRIGAEIGNIANDGTVDVKWGDKRLNTFDYTFKVVEGKDVNAFSLPGGFIYFYEGLLNYVESDDELAGVLAHEIAHASLRHVATLQREQSKLENISIPLILATILVKGSGAGVDALQLGQLVGMASRSGWSVKAEVAADYAGFQYLLKTKYNPTGMLTFMERLAGDEAKKSGYIDLGIFQTHPPSKQRVESLTKYMIERRIPITRSAVTTSYSTQIKPAERGNVEAWFNGRKIFTFGGSKASERADAAAEKLNRFFDGVPELFEVKAGQNGEIIGGRSVLFRVTQDDAAAAKKSIEDLTEQTVKEMRHSLFSLAYRVWDAR